MHAITGIDGRDDAEQYGYHPPTPYPTWETLV